MLLIWKEYFTCAILSFSSPRCPIIACLNVFYTKFRCTMIAQLNKIWRVCACARAIARHSRPGMIVGTFYQLTKFHCLVAFLEILHNLYCIIIICCPVYNVTNFEINHSYLIDLFFYLTKNLGQKCKYLKNEKSF